MKKKSGIFLRVIFGAVFPLILWVVSSLMLPFVFGEGYETSLPSVFKFFIIVLFILAAIAGAPAIFVSIIAEILQSRLKNNLHFYIAGTFLGVLCGMAVTLVSALFLGSNLNDLSEIFFALSLCIFPGFFTAFILRRMYQSSGAI